MGGCCCSSRKAQLHGTPVYYYCPPSLEGQETLRSFNGTSGLSAGLLVGINLDTSSLDTFQPPPAPIPFSVLLGHPQTPVNAVKTQDRRTLADILLKSPTKSDVEISKPCEHGQTASEEEDVCPICLEEYDVENPKMVTNCEHDFHLSCLLEWMERSDSCPVCDKEMIFDHPDDQL